MTSPTRPAAPHRARFVHLGDRLLAIARIRSGAASIELIAEELDVDPGEVANWLQLHGDDSVMSLDDVRDGDTPEVRSLTRRARLLAELVAEADRSIRELHQEYVLMLATPRIHQEL
jgi:hypothetical protein